MLLIQPRPFLRKIYPKAIWNFSRDEKNIYLTFDDGPIPGLTEWVLDELKKHEAKATFFCVGDNIQKHPSIFQRIRQEGHGVGNHSMFHTKGLSVNTEAYMKEADDCRKLVGNSLFRPPYGQMRRGQYRTLIEKGYRIVMWDVISYDYEKITPERCLDTVIMNSRKGSILVFHDNVKAEKNLKEVLPQCLDYFRNRGYNFKGIEI